MKKAIVKYVCFVLGMCILAFGLYNIHSRCAISEGGVLGATLLIRYWLGISPAVSSVILDGACFIFGIYVLGWGFLRDSIIAAGLFSGWYAIFEYVGPLLPDYSESPVKAAVLGAVFVGVGTGLAVINGGAAGGDDALALSFNRLYKVPMALVYFTTDVTVLLLSLTYIPVHKIMYSLLSVILSSVVIEVINWCKRKIDKFGQNV